MSLHFAILFWLALIFLVAATFILVLMKKTGKESNGQGVTMTKEMLHQEQSGCSLVDWVPVRALVLARASPIL